MSDLVTLCLSNEFYMTSFFHILNIHFPTEHALKNVSLHAYCTITTRPKTCFCEPTFHLFG